MSLNTGNIGGLKFVHGKGDKKNLEFPIEVATFKRMVTDPGFVPYEQCVVMANGFVIAMFVDETSMLSYIDYLGKFGFRLFPQSVMDSIRTQWEKGYNKGKG